MKRILVFTDLDGSLLDHHNYSWAEATPALEILRKKEIPVILNSSKTAAEILELRKQLDNQHPFVAENGAIAYLPDPLLQSNQDNTSLQAHYFATPYQEIIKTLADIREKQGYSFKGFFDMDADEIASVCDLGIENARNAKARQASEPLLWHDSQQALTHFESLLQEQGLIIVKGGRFYHVMSKVDKGKTLLWIKEQYENALPQAKWVTIGLGDSFNDVPMLKVVDYPVLINNPTIKQPDLDGLENLTLSSSSGPAGWNESITHLLENIH